MSGVDVIGLLTTLMPALLRVLDGLLLPGTPDVDPTCRARTEALRKFLALIRPGIEELLVALRTDRAWMRAAAAAHPDLTLPEGFEARGFDEPWVDPEYRRLLAVVDALNPTLREES